MACHTTSDRSTGSLTGSRQVLGKKAREVAGQLCARRRSEGFTSQQGIGPLDTMDR